MFHWSNGDRAAAEKSFTAALTLDRKHPVANRALAGYYVGTGRTVEAEPHLKTVAAIGGDNEKLALGDYYLRAGRLPDARLVYKTLVRDDLTSVLLHDSRNPARPNHIRRETHR